MSPNRIAAEDRVAPASDGHLTGPVTLMNSFVGRPDRDEAFRARWTETSRYFTAQPGFISLRLHRAVSADATYRWGECRELGIGGPLPRRALHRRVSAPGHSA